MADIEKQEQTQEQTQDQSADFYGGHVVNIDAASDTAADVATEETAAPDKEMTKAEREQKAVQLDRERRTQNIERLRREREREARLQENQRFLTGIKAVQESQRRKRICQGTIGAVVTKTADGSPAGDDAQEFAVILQVQMENGFIVNIPFSEFFRDNPIDMSSVDLDSTTGRQIFNRRQRQMAEKMYGAVVPFVVTDVFFDSSDDYRIMGSRREALLIMEKNNFFPVRGMEPRIKKGDFYEATIISVGFYTVFLNVGGVDATIPVRNMTFRYVRNMADYYKVGQKVLVEISDIETNKQGNVVLELSAKSVELRMAKKRQETQRIDMGTLTLATITSVRKSNTRENAVVINAYIPFYDMPAIVQGMDPRAMEYSPMAGDQIRVSVTGFNDRGFLLVRFHGNHDASTLMMR